MIKMDRQGFKTNLTEALEYVDSYVNSDDIETFLDLNFDEDSYLSEWSFIDFINFAEDVAEEGFASACRMNDLTWDITGDNEDEYEDEEDF